ncbi:arsenate-mycothiol transferase ArsC [Rhodoblastus sp.]|uniref:arsenate-mycothiol transferase ArsC n=1 Tax=Rhodoblastus sp. TaxID=1962975 RepID=UPI003F9D4949
MQAGPSHVLFACTLNSARSPMAEGLARKIFGHRLNVASAGLRAAEMDGFAICVMAEVGVALMNHVARTLSELDLARFDLMVALSPEAHDSMTELTRDRAVPVEFWPTEDVTCLECARDQKLEAYRALRDDLERRIRRRFG